MTTNNELEKAPDGILKTLLRVKQIIDNHVPDCGEIDCETCHDRHMRVAKDLLALIQAEKIKELENITDKNYSNELGTYDFDGIARNTLDRLEQLKRSK